MISIPSGKTSTMKSSSDIQKIKTIRHNRMTHDRIAHNYDANHGEIYNPTEQKRISQSIQKAINFIETGSERPIALDYGAGTGNITSHLLHFDMNVLAADVSPESLKQIAAKSGGSERLQTGVLNGKDLSNFQDNTFDLIATYSVLHHVPDYLAIIDEFVRVLKPGGVVYIDHEVCPSYWEFRNVYRTYLQELGDTFIRDYLLILEIPDDSKGQVANLVTRLKQTLSRGKMTGPVLRRLNLIHDEGDIHVTKDDHIIWEDLKNRFLPSCELLLEEDYLLCRETTEPAPVWPKWRNTVNDMRMIMARKKTVPVVLRP